ncbi:LysR family transcriptional regulator [Pseudomonas sp. LFM046]|uniref:LysR family transcriptional regulator n=1 Tax=Pseudomonas sp. LFM046 TaxID=1608357 RepID=UPI0005CFEBFD|nr:LysR family transcriptional regulator [Pseudomonas sp. LFM046]
MPGESFRDILDFIAVANERSFTRAAAHLGVSQSALSHTIRSLEARLGLRLLTRTTRSVSLTEAGERLIRRIGPRLQTITDELAAFEELRSEPAGTVRIAASDFAAKNILWPKLSPLLLQHPDVRIDLVIEQRAVDIVAEHFDAGVRFGDQVSQGLLASRISSDFRMAIVGAPEYLHKRKRPKNPSDLTHHAGINLCISNAGEAQAWTLQKGDQQLQVRVHGSWMFNGSYPALEAALAGFGLAYLPEPLVRAHIEDGSLFPVLTDWWPTVPGLHICFAKQRQSWPALSLIVEALRYRS